MSQSLPDEQRRCKNCKWWSNERLEHHSLKSDLRVCTSPNIVNLPECDESDPVHYKRTWIDGLAEDEINLEPDEAATMDGSDYKSEFGTGPEFGCVHFEAKEESP